MNGRCSRCNQSLTGNTHLLAQFRTVGGRVYWEAHLCHPCFEEVIDFIEHEDRWLTVDDQRQQCPHPHREAYMFPDPRPRILAPLWGWRCLVCGHIEKP